MRALVVATIAAVVCWLLVAAPAHAAPEASAGRVGGGTPPVASAPPRAPAADPGAPPPVGFPEIPNPLDLAEGLDPRVLAAGIVEALVTIVGVAVVEALRHFTDWALGLGGSSLNFVTRTPPAGSYASETVRDLWGLSRTIANLSLAVVVMWGGFNVMLRRHTGGAYDGVMELLPRVALAALAANLSLEVARVLVDLNNALCASVGEVGLPGYESAHAAQEGVAMILVAVSYAVVALLLVFQMLTRLALLDLLIVLAPLMMLLWVLPQTRDWTRWWTRLFPLTVFQQAVQVAALRLGSSLMVELTPGSASDALLTLLLGIAVCWMTLRVPSLLRGQVQLAGPGAIVSLVMVGHAAAAVASRGAAAARLAR